MALLQSKFCVLDIETSFEQINGKPSVSWLSFGRIKMYSVNGDTEENFTFREWHELLFFMQNLQRKYYQYEIVCYCHNLAFEFDFLMKNISKPEKILSNSTRSIISGKLEDINILFKCSYKLSGYSLAKIGEMVKLPKLEAEYINIYPDEEIPEEYLIYNERDCDIVAKYMIDIELPKWKTLSKIPLTKTGKVRKKFYEFYSQTEDKNTCEWDLMPPDNCYNAIMEAFQGAITISNPLFTNIELCNIDSYDITSSYPYTMLAEQFPYTIKKSSDFSLSQLNKPFWIAKIKFINIRSKFTWQWLSISKIQEYCKISSKFFNGKLICTDYMTRTVTNIDYQSICETYDFDDIELIEFYEMEKYDYLPTSYIETIKHFGKFKHDLKEQIKVMETEEHTEQEMQDVKRDYMLAKNDYNSIYGMAVQKLIQSEYYVDENFIWQEREIPYRCNPKKHMKRNFLFGVYILAYSRRNLLRAIIKNCPITFVYADTDSIKYMKTEPFIDTNLKLRKEFLEIPSLADLGEFDFELTYKEFKVLGAKKYCYTKQGSDKVILTVAGLPKKEEYPIYSIDDFKPGVNFENCKLAKAYINNQAIVYMDWESHEIIEYIEDMKLADKFMEEHNIESNGGVVLYPTSYLLNITKEDKFIISEYQKSLHQFLKNNEHLRRFFKYGEEI